MPALSLVEAPTQVQVAGSGILTSPGILMNVQWSIEQCSFTSSFQVLQLSTYDVIVVMDWLEAYSSMQVHWQEKWLAIPFLGHLEFLQGVQSNSPDHLYLQVCALSSQPDDDLPDLVVPPEIQQLLQQFALLFEAPTELLPSRACNHRISLIPGAQPVFMRPYRYPPGLKDEIE